MLCKINLNTETHTQDREMEAAGAAPTERQGAVGNEFSGGHSSPSLPYKYKVGEMETEEFGLSGMGRGCRGSWSPGHGWESPPLWRNQQQEPGRPRGSIRSCHFPAELFASLDS